MEVVQFLIRVNKTDEKPTRACIPLTLDYLRKADYFERYFEKYHNVFSNEPYRITLDDVKDILERVKKVIENRKLERKLIPQKRFCTNYSDYCSDNYYDLEEIKKEFSKIIKEWNEKNIPITIFGGFKTVIFTLRLLNGSRRVNKEIATRSNAPTPTSAFERLI